MLQTQKADEITAVLWGSFQFLENLDGVIKKTLNNFTEMWFSQFSVLLKSENGQQNYVFIITGVERALWKLQNHQILSEKDALLYQQVLRCIKNTGVGILKTVVNLNFKWEDEVS